MKSYHHAYAIANAIRWQEAAAIHARDAATAYHVKMYHHAAMLQEQARECHHMVIGYMVVVNAHTDRP